MGFSPSELYLGEFPWFDQAEFELKFCNPTAGPVRIATVSPSCGCTVIDASLYADREVAAGETLLIAGRLDVAATLGEQRKRIDVLIASGAIHTAFVEFSVFSTYEVAPEVVEFGVVDLDASGEHVRTAVFSSSTVQIVGPAAIDSPWLNVGMRELGGGRTELVLRVTKELARDGPDAAHARFSTTDTHRPTFVVTARIEGRRQLRAFPTQHFLKPGASEMVQFLAADGSQVRLLEARTQDQSVAVAIAANGNELRVELLAGSPGNLRERGASIEVTDVSGNKATVLVFEVY